MEYKVKEVINSVDGKAVPVAVSVLLLVVYKDGSVDFRDGNFRKEEWNAAGRDFEDGDYRYLEAWGLVEDYKEVASVDSALVYRIIYHDGSVAVYDKIKNFKRGRKSR